MRSLTAVGRGAVAIDAATARAGIPPTAVDWVAMGHVLQAGAGQNPARQAALGLADQMIRAGEVETVVAGGMESMTNAPRLLPTLRLDARVGDAQTVDAMMFDGLWSTFSGQVMGESSDEVNAESGRAHEFLSLARPAADDSFVWHHVNH